MPTTLKGGHSALSARRRARQLLGQRRTRYDAGARPVYVAGEDVLDRPLATVLAETGTLLAASAAGARQAACRHFNAARGDSPRLCTWTTRPAGLWYEADFTAEFDAARDCWIVSYNPSLVRVPTPRAA